MALEAEGGQHPFFPKKLKIIEWDSLKLNITSAIAIEVSSLNHPGFHSPWLVLVSEQQISAPHILETSLMNEKKRTLLHLWEEYLLTKGVNKYRCLCKFGFACPFIQFSICETQNYNKLSLRVPFSKDWPLLSVPPVSCHTIFTWFYVDID